jgi:hypothetical protein
LTIEEIRYDFKGFRKYADDFIHDLIKLMIISKMNCPYNSELSRNYFLGLVKQIAGCETYIVKYGQPMLYIRYRGIEFTEQKVTSKFVRFNEYAIEVILESVFAEFVKSFDNLSSSSEDKVKWAIVTDKYPNAEPLFKLLNLFIDAVHKLTLLDPSNPESLIRKKFGVRNVNVTRHSTQLEFLIDSQLNIIALNPSRKKKDHSIVLLMGNSETAKAISCLMKQ